MDMATGHFMHKCEYILLMKKVHTFKEKIHLHNGKANMKNKSRADRKKNNT